MRLWPAWLLVLHITYAIRIYHLRKTGLEYITVNMSNLRKAIQMVQSSVSNLDVKEHEEFNEKYGEKWLKEEMNEEFQTRLSRFSQSMYKLVNSKIQHRNLMI